MGLFKWLGKSLPNSEAFDRLDMASLSVPDDSDSTALLAAQIGEDAEELAETEAHLFDSLGANADLPEDERERIAVQAWKKLDEETPDRTHGFGDPPPGWNKH